MTADKSHNYSESPVSICEKRMGSLCRPLPCEADAGAAASLYRVASRSSGAPPHYPSTTMPVHPLPIRHATRPPHCPSTTLPVYPPTTLPARHTARTTVSASASSRGGSAVRSAEPGQCLRPFGSRRVSTAEVRDTIQDRLGTDRVAHTAATGRVRPCWDRQSLQRQVRTVPLHLPTLVKDPCSTLSPPMKGF